jgi:hypothetical protein
MGGLRRKDCLADPRPEQQTSFLRGNHISAGRIKWNIDGGASRHDSVRNRWVAGVGRGRKICCYIIGQSGNRLTA